MASFCKLMIGFKISRCGVVNFDHIRTMKELNQEIVSELKFIDLFAGIGGFHLALHDLGAECVFASEINPFARKTYIHNHTKI